MVFFVLGDIADSLLLHTQIGVIKENIAEDNQWSEGLVSAVRNHLPLSPSTNNLLTAYVTLCF